MCPRTADMERNGREGLVLVLVVACFLDLETEPRDCLPPNPEFMMFEGWLYLSTVICLAEGMSWGTICKIMEQSKS